MSAMNIITNWPWTIDQQSETMREFQSCWSCCNSHIWRLTNCAVLVLKTILSKNPSLFPQAPQTWVNLAQQSHRNAICSYVSRQLEILWSTSVELVGFEPETFVVTGLNHPTVQPQHVGTHFSIYCLVTTIHTIKFHTYIILQSHRGLQVVWHLGQSTSASR